MTGMNIEGSTGATGALERFAIEDRTLTNALVDAAERHGARDFLSIGGRDVTFADVPRIASSVATGFAARGAKKGHIAAVLLGNQFEFMAAVWGMSWLGGVALPVNTALRGASLGHVLNDSEAATLICGEEHLARIAELAGRLPQISDIIVVGDARDFAFPGAEIIDWAKFTAAGPLVAAEPVSFDDPLMLIYTSGTTGPAKGVMMSHHHYYSMAASAVDHMEWGPADHLFTSLPLCHAQAQMAILSAGLMVGARVTISARFSASSFWHDVTACGATAANLGPTVNLVARQPASEADRGHRLRTLLCNPPPPDPAGFEKRFGVKLIWQGYGMTEGYFNPRTIGAKIKSSACVGQASPLFEMEIVDEHDVPRPHDGEAVGEIVVRPRQPSVMFTGYHKNPAATAEAFRNLWFHTGDLGSIDEEGYMFFCGRKKDAIRRRGENVSAVEIERVALAHAEVAQAAAFGVPSPLGEEDIKLDIVRVEGSTLAVEALIEFLRGELAPFMMPRYIQFRSAMPMTASEKIEKYRLKAEGVAAANYDGGDRGAKLPPAGA